MIEQQAVGSGDSSQHESMQVDDNSNAMGRGEGDQRRAQQVANPHDEQVRNALKRYRCENQLDWQRRRSTLQCTHFLKRALPIYEGCVTFAASIMYFGSACDSLAAVLESSYAMDKQQGKAIAYVQSSGCGKTRTVMQLAVDHDYVVLPFQCSNSYCSASGELLEALVVEEANLRSALGDQASSEQIRTFSDGCLRLVHLALFSVLALFKHCVETKLVDAWNAAHRHELAVLLLLRCHALEMWLVAYFNEHKQAILDMTSSEFEALVNETVTNKLKPGIATPKVVFLLPKAHYGRRYCRGYSLHVEAAEDGDEMREQWLFDQSMCDGATDLLYQLKQVMVKCSQIGGTRMAFVLCSSKLKVADSIDTSGEIIGGDMIRFSDMHWFTAEEIRQLIQEYFDLPDKIFSEFRMKELKLLARPYFVRTLLESIAVSSADEGVAHLLGSALRVTWISVTESTKRGVQSLVERRQRLIYDENVERRLHYSVYTVAKLYGVECVVREKFVPSIVGSGIMRLTTGAANEVICDEALCFKELESEVTRTACGFADCNERDAVLQELLTPLIINANNGLSVEAFAAERILAWIVLRDGLKVTTSNGELLLAVDHWICQSATIEQLRNLYQRECCAADYVWQLISCKYYRCIFFAKSHCGPDLIISVYNLSRYTAVFRCEMQLMELDKFSKMVKSLHPAHYFEKTKKKDGSDEYRIAERQRWLEILRFGGSKELARVRRFYRIVFAGRGFALHVQYLVAEYNASVGRGSSKLIYLMNLHDLEQQIDEVNYAALENLLKDSTGQVHVQAHEAVMLQSEWMQMSTLEKENTSFEELEKLCLQRNISVTKAAESENGDKCLQSKTSEELISELDTYNVMQVIDGLNWGLDFNNIVP